MASTKIPPETLRTLRSSSRLINLSVLNALPTVALRARYLVENAFKGQHRSLLKGTSPEFADYRSYQVGDDLKRLDWRLYARSDRLAIKRYEDENQQATCLAIDLSGSLRYRSRPDLPTKLDLARTLLAALALLVRRQQDSLGLALLGDVSNRESDGILDFLPIRSSPAHHRALLARLESPPEPESLSLIRSLRRLATLLPRGSRIILVSDFYEDPDPLSAVLREYQAQRLELIGIQVLDPTEITFSMDDNGLFADLETGATLPVNSRAARAAYLQRFARFQNDLAEIFRETQARWITLRTDESPFPGLIACLQAIAPSSR